MTTQSSPPASPPDRPALRAGEMTEMRVTRRFEWWLFLGGMATASVLLCIAGWILCLMLGRSYPWESTAAAIAYTLWFWLVVRRDWERLRRILKGALGEREVGQILDELRNDGYFAVHGLTIRATEDGRPVGDIDHVLVGRAGVFVVETKRLSKNSRGRHPTVIFDGQSVTVDGFSPDRNPIAQARGGALEVSRMIRAATGREIWVNAIVVYPGCWVKAVSEPAPEISVMNPKQLFAWLRRHAELGKRNRTLLTPSDITLLHHVLLNAASRTEI